MKKPSVSLLILIIILFESCGRDPEQAKKYSDMKSNCDSLIAQADLIINSQKAITDSLSKIRDEYLKVNARNKLTEIDRKISNAVEIRSKIENVRKHLEAIKGFANNGEKATERLIYYKRKYITYATVIQVHDENVMIQEITDGLSAKQYFSKYQPKKNK